jgi:hypothetical protein
MYIWGVPMSNWMSEGLQVFIDRRRCQLLYQIVVQIKARIKYAGAGHLAVLHMSQRPSGLCKESSITNRRLPLCYYHSTPALLITSFAV